MSYLQKMILMIFVLFYLNYTFCKEFRAQIEKISERIIRNHLYASLHRLSYNTFTYTQPDKLRLLVISINPMHTCIILYTIIQTIHETINNPLSQYFTRIRFMQCNIIKMSRTFPYSATFTNAFTPIFLVSRF